MAKKSAPRPKRIPQRTCIACRTSAGKREMVRLVRTAEGVEIDPTGKKAGRGAYLCNTYACWEQAVSTNRIAAALRTKVDDESAQKFAEYMDTLTMENHV